MPHFARFHPCITGEVCARMETGPLQHVDGNSGEPRTMIQRRDQPITELLAAVGVGKPGAAEQLWGAVYEELRRFAKRQMASERGARTLQPTALVHEAYFRLFPDGDAQFANRQHFFAAAAKAMRRIRIDDARKRKRLKRGGDRRPFSIEDSPSVDSASSVPTPAVFDDDPSEVLAIDEALERLAVEHPRKAEVIEYRYFAGLSARETAEVMGVSPRTVDLDWRFAKAWLHKALG